MGVGTFKIVESQKKKKNVYGKVGKGVVLNDAFERMVTWPSLLPNESLHMRKAL